MLKILERLSLEKTFLLLTIQKVLPLLVLRFIFSPVAMAILVRAVVGATGGVLAKNLGHIIGYSSLVNLAWIMAVSVNVGVLLLFLFLYSIRFLVWAHALGRGPSLISPELIPQRGVLGLNFVLALLRIRGVPPFLGFLAKLVRLGELLNTGFIIVSFFLLMFSGIMLIPYLRLIFSFFTQFSFNSIQTKVFHRYPL